MKYIICLLFLNVSIAKAQFVTQMKVEYSKNVEDSFEIYISKPVNHDEAKPFDVVYYCDANLKSGKMLRKMLDSGSYDAGLKNTLFVGVGHIGNYHVLRRRDFIPFTPHGDTRGSIKSYGQTEHFYQYLKQELVPAINAAYKTDTTKNSILGHSLGGLFAFYCLFKNADLFANYYALSPALWINGYSVYKFNYINGGFANKKYLYFAAGSKEVYNYILKGTNLAKAVFDKKIYSNLKYEYKVVADKTHNSEVPVSLDKILKELETIKN